MKTALVVGASGGIGRAISVRLAKDGYRVLAHGRDEKALEETVRRVRDAGSDGETRSADISDMEQVESLAHWASDRGPLNAVVWSAGGGKSVSAGPDAIAEWERVLAMTLRAPMRLTALTLDAVRAGEGHFLYVAGMYAKFGIAKLAGNCAGRHGLEGFAKALFEEGREDGVGVTLLHPGFVHTRLTNTDRLDPEKMIKTADIAETAELALTMPRNACVTEMLVRPQKSPYR